MGLFSSLWSIWLHSLHGSLYYIGITFTVFALPSMLLTPWTGKLADRWPRRWLILPSSIGLSAIYVAYGYTTNLAVIIVIGVIEGMLIAVATPAIDSYLANVAPVEAWGRAQGTYNAEGATRWAKAQAQGDSCPLHLSSRLPRLPFVGPPA